MIVAGFSKPILPAMFDANVTVNFRWSYMLKLNQIDVYISYRYDSGPDSPPRNRQLMARVFTPGSASAPGSPIAPRRYCTSFTDIKTECVRELNSRARTIRLHVDSLVSQYCPGAHSVEIKCGQ